MSHQALVIGTVEYRLGEGPKCLVPKGPVEIELSDLDVTLSWETDETRQSGSMPKADFGRYLAEKDIELVERT